jgi:holo-[acyl-carrier protein] synthase
MEFPPSNLAAGIDVVSIRRIERILKNYPNKFRNFAYTSSEQQYCDDQCSPSQHYAVRWAAKEAYIKTVGKFDGNPDLTSIEVIREPVPHLNLTGDGYRLLSEVTSDKGVSPDSSSIALSMTHERDTDLALGFVLIIF